MASLCLITLLSVAPERRKFEVLLEQGKNTNAYEIVLCHSVHLFFLVFLSMFFELNCQSDIHVCIYLSWCYFFIILPKIMIF